MTPLAVLFGILGALLLGAMSPGPSFVLVTRLAVTGLRRSGVAAALGMGIGGMVFALLALVGLITVLQQVEWLFLALKICGGLYLVYLGLCIWRGATHPMMIPAAGGDATSGDMPRRAAASVARAFWLGLTTQVANPKTAVVYASIFAALLPADPTPMLLVVLPIAIFLVEAGWYALVAVLFSTKGPQRAYLRSKGWFDRTAGVVLAGLGVRLIVEEVR